VTHRRKPIVKMNGKKIDKEVNKATWNRSIKDEVAATVEKTNHFTNERAKKKSVGSNRGKQLILKFKPLITTIFLALIIGSIFGFVMLKIFGTIDNGMATPGNNPVVNLDKATEKDDEIEGEDNIELPTIQAYILQGGVFSSEENAEEFARKYQENEIPTIIWPRENEYFLLLGVAHTLEKGEKLASRIEEEELEVFVKEWATQASEISLTSNEEEWINSFQKWLTSSIEELDEQENSSISSLEKLLSDLPDDSGSLESFKESIQAIVKKVKEDGRSPTQEDLLNMWLQYELFIEK